MHRKIYLTKEEAGIQCMIPELTVMDSMGSMKNEPSH